MALVNGCFGQSAQAAAMTHGAGKHPGLWAGHYEQLARLLFCLEAVEPMGNKRKL